MIPGAGLYAMTVALAPSLAWSGSEEVEVTEATFVSAVPSAIEQSTRASSLSVSVPPAARDSFSHAIVPPGGCSAQLQLAGTVGDRRAVP